MRAHEAGALHGDLGPRPGLAAYPEDVNALRRRSCGRAPSTRTTTAPARSAASTSATWRAEFGTPAYVLDEADFRARVPGRSATAFGGADVYYAGKAFLCQGGACGSSPRRA